MASDPGIEVTVEVDGEDLVAGTLRVYTRRGQSTAFQYAEDYLADPRAYELDPALPLHSGVLLPPGGKTLFNAFSDTAPDRWGENLMRRQERDRARAGHTAPRTLGPVDFLLGVHDELRQGALRLRSPGSETYLAPDETGVPKLIALPRLVAAADSFFEGGDSDLRDLFAAGGSLGGARPKAAVRTPEGTLALAKFPRRGADQWDVEGWEKVQHVLAARSGIDVVKSRLLDMGGRKALVVERFDREGDRRIGFMSALTALEASDMDTRSYLELAEVIAVGANDPARDLEQLFRRVVFCILTSNTDDHLRNHGLLRRSRGWDLSPAYDLNPDPEHIGRLSMAVDLDDTSADLDLAFSVAGFFRLSPEHAKEIVAEIDDATRGWRDVASRLGLAHADITLMEQAYETPQRQVARRIASGPAVGT